MFWKGQVFVCGGSSNKKCFVYGIETDAWNDISSISTQDHSSFSGSSYQGKIYLASDQVSISSIFYKQLSLQKYFSQLFSTCNLALNYLAQEY
jgi:hypothetical protein